MVIEQKTDSNKAIEAPCLAAMPWLGNRFVNKSNDSCGIEVLEDYWYFVIYKPRESSELHKRLIELYTNHWNEVQKKVQIIQYESVRGDNSPWVCLPYDPDIDKSKIDEVLGENAFTVYEAKTGKRVESEILTEL